jgi:hypothetical protein
VQDNDMERRGKPRIYCKYPAIVRGLDSRGGRFEENALLSNLSASGVYVLVSRPIVQGSKLSVAFRFSSKATTQVPAVVARGVVVRSDRNPDGTNGLGVKFERYRVL